jgi:hypothetical protein
VLVADATAFPSVSAQAVPSSPVLVAFAQARRSGICPPGNSSMLRTSTDVEVVKQPPLNPKIKAESGNNKKFDDLIIAALLSC